MRALPDRTRGRGIGGAPCRPYAMSTYVALAAVPAAALAIQADPAAASLERSPFAGLRVIDNHGDTLDVVHAHQQVQLTTGIAYLGDDPFACIVQVQDAGGAVVHMASISGTLVDGQSLEPSVSWTPPAAGSYTATAFLWESIRSQSPITAPVSLDILVV